MSGWPDPNAAWEAAKAAGGWVGDKAAQGAKAAQTAGGWLRDKTAEAGQAALDSSRQLAQAAERRARELAAAADRKARQLVDAADRAARERVRALQANTVDALSQPVARGSEAYQQGKAQVGAARERLGQARDQIGGAIDRAKRAFGMDVPAPTAPCPPKPVSGASPLDGSLLVPTEQCPADAIPIGEGGVPAAMAKAKAQTTSSTSKCCAAQPAEVRNQTVYYINGINTPAATHCKTLRMMRDMTCGRVIGILNDTEGPVTDAIRTADARQMIKDEIGAGPARDYPGFSPAVKTMQDVMATEAASGGHPRIYAHSEGGAITSLAAIRAKTALRQGGMGDAMGNLSITSMGSAAPAWPDGPQYTHYIHATDVVPNTLGLGDAARRPGAGADIVRFGGRRGGFTTMDGSSKLPYGTWSDGSDPIADHYADTSYIPYINDTRDPSGRPRPPGSAPNGCFGQP